MKQMNTEPTKKIPLSLFTELEQFAMGERSAEDIKKSLNKFFEYRRQKDFERLLYSASKTGITKEIKEQAYQAYLDEKGIPKGFRW